MSDQFEIVEQAIGPVVEIEERVPMWRMPATFGRDYKQIADYLESQGAECVGMPYARYQEMDWGRDLGQGKLAALWAMLTKKWHFFVGMPCSKHLSGGGLLVARELDSRRYVRGVHRGPYRECGGTYRALYDWTRGQGLVLRSEAIECYVNDPREVAKADIETVILIPVDE